MWVAPFANPSLKIDRRLGAEKVGTKAKPLARAGITLPISDGWMTGAGSLSQPPNTDIGGVGALRVIKHLPPPSSQHLTSCHFLVHSLFNFNSRPI
jgi:hypothetical protein